MRFDTVIIGGGLAGLMCGIRLAGAGERCAIISSGQSALHFWSGSLDLLSALPDGQEVENPIEGALKIASLAPSHPYAKLGADNFAELATRAKSLLQQAGVHTVGDAARNHYRLSPMGVLRPTWLTFEGYVATPQRSLRWRRVALFNAEGFLDFYPQFLCDELRRMGTQCHAYTFNLPALESIRENPTEMRSANIARIFDNENTLEQLADQIKSKMGDAEAVLLPAFLGVDSLNGVKYLQQRLGCDVAVVATMPPSVPGIQVQTLLRRYFQELGGLYLLGDTAVGYKAEGNRISSLYTANHGDIALRANNFVLATGSYFSGGLEADNREVREPLFGLDVVSEKERNAWYENDIFETQPYESFGVDCDKQLRALRGGRAIDNLYVAGACMAGFNGVKQGCGAGVSILTALRVADIILSNKE